MSSVSGRNGNCLDQVLPEKAESQSVFGQNLHGDAGSGGRKEECGGGGGARAVWPPRLICGTAAARPQQPRMETRAEDGGYIHPYLA